MKSTPHTLNISTWSFSLVAWRLGNWYSHAFDILGNAAQILLLLQSCLARRIHSTKLFHGYGRLRNVLHMARSDNAQEFCGSHTLGYNIGVDHQHRLWIDMGHPIGEIGWGVSISSYFSRRYVPSHHEVHQICISWTGCSNLQKSIISQIVVDQQVRSLYLHSGEMICHAIICSILISYLQVKLLEEQNPTDELWLCILLG